MHVDQGWVLCHSATMRLQFGVRLSCVAGALWRDSTCTKQTSKASLYIRAKANRYILRLIRYTIDHTHQVQCGHVSHIQVMHMNLLTGLHGVRAPLLPTVGSSADQINVLSISTLADRPVKYLLVGNQ